MLFVKRFPIDKRIHETVAKGENENENIYSQLITNSTQSFNEFCDFTLDLNEECNNSLMCFAKHANGLDLNDSEVVPCMKVILGINAFFGEDAKQSGLLKSWHTKLSQLKWFHFRGFSL